MNHSIAPTFVTITSCPGDASTYGPFWSLRSARRWLNHHEEMNLGSTAATVTGRWRSRRKVGR